LKFKVYRFRHELFYEMLRSAHKRLDILEDSASPGYLQQQPSFDHAHHERRGGWLQHASSKEAQREEAEEGKHVLKAKLAGR
jgi:hypothetical protein